MQALNSSLTTTCCASNSPPKLKLVPFASHSAARDEMQFPTEVGKSSAYSKAAFEIAVDLKDSVAVFPLARRVQCQ